MLAASAKKGNCASSPLGQMARKRKSVNNNQALEGCTKHISYRVCTSFRNSLEMHFAVIRNVYKPKPFIANILYISYFKDIEFFYFCNQVSWLVCHSTLFAIEMEPFNYFTGSRRYSNFILLYRNYSYLSRTPSRIAHHPTLFYIILRILDVQMNNWPRKWREIQFF